MIHAYSELYLNSVIKSIAALFDMAVNSERLDSDSFAELFAKSDIASGIEAGVPELLAGTSAGEMLTMLLDRDIKEDYRISVKSPEYQAGLVLALTQWYLNKSFSEILAVMPFSKFAEFNSPYRDADRIKIIKWINSCFPVVSALKVMRQKRKLTQEQLALLSGVNIRSIRSYEQGDNDIAKAQGETLQLLAQALDCSIEELLK